MMVEICYRIGGEEYPMFRNGHIENGMLVVDGIKTHNVPLDMVYECATSVAECTVYIVDEETGGNETWNIYGFTQRTFTPIRTPWKHDKCFAQVGGLIPYPSKGGLVMKEVISTGDFDGHIYNVEAFIKNHACELVDLKIIWTDSTGVTTTQRFEEEPDEDEMAEGPVTVGDLMNAILETNPKPRKVALRYGGIELVLFDSSRDKGE